MAAALPRPSPGRGDMAQGLPHPLSPRLAAPQALRVWSCHWCSSTGVGTRLPTGCSASGLSPIPLQGPVPSVSTHLRRSQPPPRSRGPTGVTPAASEAAGPAQGRPARRAPGKAASLAGAQRRGGEREKGNACSQGPAGAEEAGGWAGRQTRRRGRGRAPGRPGRGRTAGWVPTSPSPLPPRPGGGVRVAAPGRASGTGGPSDPESSSDPGREAAAAVEPQHKVWLGWLLRGWRHKGVARRVLDGCHARACRPWCWVTCMSLSWWAIVRRDAVPVPSQG